MTKIDPPIPVVYKIGGNYDHKHFSTGLAVGVTIGLAKFSTPPFIEVCWDNFRDGHCGILNYGPTVPKNAIWAVHLTDLLPNTRLECFMALRGLKTTKPVLSLKPSDTQFHSQKAKGVYHLTTHEYSEFNAPKAKFYPRAAGVIKFPVFARPCPSVPRHGFVDSRLVNNREEFNGLVKEIEATGEPTEIILMDFLKPDYSGVVTPNSVTIGKGHDGATSGTSAKVIPALTSVKELAYTFHFSGPDIGINKPDVPYGEFVGKFNDDRSTIVQLRGGPALSGSTLRYVPERFEVKYIERAEGDLLAWETKVTTFKPGTVVYHPNGSLSSHYSVHCILHKIPVLIDKEPRIGEILEPENEVKALTNQDYNTLAQYLAHVITKPVHDPREDKLKTAVASLHAQSLWDNQNHLLALRADGAATVFRYAAAACFAELRHFSCHGPGGKPETPIEWDCCETFNREFVFKKVYRHNIRAVLEALPLVIKDYEHEGWGQGAYGGKKWAECSRALYTLGQGIQNFLHNKNAKAWHQVVSGWNQTVNAVHNGGGLLTKHIESRFLDDVAVNPSIGFVNPYAAKLVLGAESYGRNLKPGKALPKNSRKPALTLYPFTLKTTGFRKTFRNSESINGLYHATFISHNAKGYYKVKLPYITTVDKRRNAVQLTFNDKGIAESLTGKIGSVLVKHGYVMKVWYNGKVVKNFER